MSDTSRQALLAGERAGGRYVLRAPRNLPTGAVGVQQGSWAGSSLDFKEHRDYEPGDDLRHIDWNAFARSDHLVVKRFHEEVTPHLDVILDGSRSMSLAGTAKRDAALALTALFTTAARNAGFAHRVWLVEEGCTQLEGSNGLPATWPPPPFNFAGHVGDSFTRQPPRLKSRGLRIFISDLMWLGNPMQVLGLCGDGAAALVVAQVLAGADSQPPERGNLRLVDAETEQVLELVVDGPAVRKYQDALERHQGNWQDACRRAGAFMTILQADKLLHDWRLDELVAGEILQVV